QVVFSANGARAAALTRSGVELYDTTGKAGPETLSPTRLLGNRIELNPVLAQAALSPDGTRVVFATLSSTDQPVRATKHFDSIYDTLVEWDGRRLKLFYGDLAAAQGGRAVTSTRCLAYGGDGKALLAGDAAMLRVWDLGQDRQHNDNTAAAFTLGVPVE